MTSLPPEVRRYLTKRARKGPWRLSGEQSGWYCGAVVIPSLAEGDNLFKTLESLARNPEEFTERFLVIVVINHSEVAEAEVRAQNDADLAALAESVNETGLKIAWVNAASDGLALPARQAGVGFARKLGLDLALAQLDWKADPVLVCLDADTLVERDYFEAITRHFKATRCGAAVLPFRHQPAQSPAQQAAIDRYELFLRSYVFGLSLAGSPYAFNTVGSAMACRAAAYIRCGGMNTRKAGEDYYFLQQLAKTDGVSALRGTTVFPQPRPSARVPFGTGRSVARLLDGDNESVLFYPLETFQVLADWLALVSTETASSAEALLAKAYDISPHLAAYLGQLDWLTQWSVIQRTSAHREKRLAAFHVWFDGFRTLKLIHLLCDKEFSRGEPEDLLPAYFAWQGQVFTGAVSEALELLRARDVSSI